MGWGGGGRETTHIARPTFFFFHRILGTGRERKRDIIHLSLQCDHQNDSCIKMGSDESHSSVSLIVTDKGTRHCPQTTIFEDKRRTKAIRTEVHLLTSLTPYRQAKPAH